MLLYLKLYKKLSKVSSLLRRCKDLEFAAGDDTRHGRHKRNLKLDSGHAIYI